MAETPEHIKIKTDRMEIKPWKESRPSRPATSVRAQRTAAAANARPHASLPVRPAAAWPTRSARIRITKLGRRVYNNVMDDRQSIRGQRYVWMGGDLASVEQDKDSDIFAVENGYISITPVHINMTETNRINELKALGIEQ